MSNINEERIALEKAEKMICSCRTNEHFINTKIYIELFYKKYNDCLLYKYLTDLLISKLKILNA